MGDQAFHAFLIPLTKLGKLNLGLYDLQRLAGSKVGKQKRSNSAVEFVKGLAATLSAFTASNNLPVENVSLADDRHQQSYKPLTKSQIGVTPAVV